MQLQLHVGCGSFGTLQQPTSHMKLELHWDVDPSVHCSTTISSKEDHVQQSLLGTRYQHKLVLRCIHVCGRPIIIRNGIVKGEILLSLERAVMPIAAINCWLICGRHPLCTSVWADPDKHVAMSTNRAFRLLRLRGIF